MFVSEFIGCQMSASAINAVRRFRRGVQDGFRGQTHCTSSSPCAACTRTSGTDILLPHSIVRYVTAISSFTWMLPCSAALPPSVMLSTNTLPSDLSASTMPIGLRRFTVKRCSPSACLAPAAGSSLRFHRTKLRICGRDGCL